MKEREKIVWPLVKQETERGPLLLPFPNGASLLRSSFAAFLSAKLCFHTSFVAHFVGPFYTSSCANNAATQSQRGRKFLSICGVLVYDSRIGCAV